MAITSTLEELYAPIQAELDEVRTRVEATWIEALELVQGRAALRPAIGGKMLRPALSLLSAGASAARDIARFVPMASAMELLHLAALAHDDVIDRADVRRGATSLNALWNNHTAVLTGDYLVARALSALTTYDSCDALSGMIDTIRQMAEGELVNFGKDPERFAQEDCIELAKSKTATLFAAACSTPAIVTQAAMHDTLHRFGLALGVAFQLVDDVLDLVQDEETLGKPACADIVEGKRTLPILLIREKLDAKGLARLDALDGATPTDDDRSWVSAMLTETGARSRTQAVAQGYVTQAQAVLTELPASPYRDAMSSLSEYVLIRGS